ncbi:Hypothetical protein SynRCC307_2427 [Synechococcus sp. RCC307]|jgi:hypothetical protein|nr:Hypothetical protein SynRCC307_2427 [Synechococcus sp. RCC307]
MVSSSENQGDQAMGAFIYDTNGMLLFSGLNKAAALAYANLFELAQFTLVIREPRNQGH